MHPVHEIALQADLAAGNVLQPGNHVQESGLSATGGSDENKELSFANRDVHVVQHLNRPVGLGGAVDVEKAHCSAFHRTRHQAPHEEAARDDVDEKSWKRGKNRPREMNVVFLHPC